jgi:plastocyanin
MFRALSAAAVCALVAAAAAAGNTSATTLHGTVGPGFTITLKKGGAKVTRLAPGTYRLVVADRSAAHNFVLEKSRGGRFERAITSVGFTGTKTVTVKLTAGRWEVYCAPHEAAMHAEFVVGAGRAED